MTEELAYIKTGNLLADACKIIDSAKSTAYRAVNTVLVQRNWFLGKRITDELIGDQTREELYGKSLIQNLAKELTATYGSGFDFSSLYKYIRFYQSFPDILDTATPKSFSSNTHPRTYVRAKYKEGLLVMGGLRMNE